MKTQKFFNLFVLSAIIALVLSACSPPASGNTAAPAEGDKLTLGQIACKGQIGIVTVTNPETKKKEAYDCNGSSFKFTKEDELSCMDEASIIIDGTRTYDGENYRALCTVVADSIELYGYADLAVATEPTPRSEPANTKPAATEPPVADNGSMASGKVPACAESFSAYLDLIGSMTDAQLRDYQSSCGVSFESKASRNVQAAAFGSDLDYGSWEYFAQFSAGLTEADMHGALIDKLDALYVGIERDFDGQTHITTAADEVEIIMAGLYTVQDVTFSGQVFPYLVEGKTGVWVAMPGSDIVIPGANAHFTLNNWTGETAPREGKASLVMGRVKAEACAPVSGVNSDIAAYAGTPTLFEEMDKTSADNQEATIRYGYAATIVNAEAGKTLTWSSLERPGRNWRLVSSADGMGLFVADQSGELEMYGPYGGIQLCNPLPHYEDYPTADPGNKPAMQRACVRNADALVAFNRYWDDSESLYSLMSLWPMSIYPEPINHEFDGLWNTIVIGRNFVDGMPETDILMPFSMTDKLGVGNDEFAGSAFIKTDGVAQVEGPYGVISFCDGPFSPAESIDQWGS